MTGDAFLGRVDHALVARLRERIGVTVPVGSALHLHLAHWRADRAILDRVTPGLVAGCRHTILPRQPVRLTLRRMA